MKGVKHLRRSKREKEGVIYVKLDEIIIKF